MRYRVQARVPRSPGRRHHATRDQARRSLFDRALPRWLAILPLVLLIPIAVVNQTRLIAGRDGNFYRGVNYPIGLDFAAFYAAGQSILAGEDADLLYDEAAQPQRQRSFLGSDLWSGRSFAYPAFAALPFVPLSRLSYLSAFGLFFLAQVVSIVAVVALLRSVSPAVRAAPVLVGLAVFAFPPTIRSLITGTTVGFSLLCLTGTYVGLRRGHPVLAGICLGALCYKPTLALPIVALVLWRRQWRAAGTAAAVVLGLSAAGMAVVGPGWPASYLALVGSDAYQLAEWVNAGRYSISLVGLAQEVFGPTGPTIALVTLVFTVAGGLLMLAAWRRAGRSADWLPLQYGLAVAIGLLVSPHALYYESVLLVLPTIALADRWYAERRVAGVAPGLSPRQCWALVGLHIAGSLWPVANDLDWEPLVGLVVVVAWLVWRTLRSVPTGSVAAIDPFPGYSTESPRLSA